MLICPFKSPEANSTLFSLFESLFVGFNSINEERREEQLISCLFSNKEGEEEDCHIWIRS